MLLKVTNLYCERDYRILFEQLAFELEAGEVLKVSGANGAGKTTLLRVLCGLYQEYEGDVEWQLDSNPLYLGHKAGVKDLLTCAENLVWSCALYGAQYSSSRIQEALAQVGLDAYHDMPASNLSEGQRKRVNLARFYLLESPVWLMDEPLSAIDVDGVIRLESLINTHVHQGGAVIFSSHQPLELDVGIRDLNLSNEL